MWSFFGLAVLVGVLVYLWADYLFARVTITPDEEYERWVWRRSDLEHAYWAFVATHGRPPTATELWEDSPPEFPEED